MSKEKRAPSPLGSSFDSFLVETGIHHETTEHAVKAVFAWQLDEMRKAKGLSKKQFAELLGTSRSQLDRVLDPDNEGVTIETLKKAAHILGKKVHLELVDETRLVKA
jgi:antitoxin HicB